MRHRGGGCWRLTGIRTEEGIRHSDDLGEALGLLAPRIVFPTWSRRLTRSLWRRSSGWSKGLTDQHDRPHGPETPRLDLCEVHPVGQRLAVPPHAMGPRRHVAVEHGAHQSASEVVHAEPDGR
jgi:hypothetical protein